MTHPLSPAPESVPAGYPRAYQRRLRLQDGREVFVRPIVPDDAAALGEAFREADPQTLRNRFMGGAPAVTPALLERLTTLDYDRRFALVAADDRTGHGVAIARYEAVDPDTAEVAVVVDPAWRRVGLATMLVELLAEAALGHGIREFTAFYIAENRPVAKLVHLAGESGRQDILQGMAEAAVHLNQDQVRAALRALDRADEPTA